MPYDYYDANGFVAPGPTIAMWSRIRSVITGPDAEEFVSTGVTDNPDALARYVEDTATANIGRSAEEPDLALDAALRALARAAEKAEGILVITQGVAIEDSRP